MRFCCISLSVIPISEITDALESVGLTRAEAKIYIFLLQHGSSRPTEITKNVQLHRRTVYDALRRLVKKGVISYIMKNNRHCYEVLRPERFKEIMKQKEEAFDNVLPKLSSMYGLQPKKEETKFFKGRTGIKAVFEDQINEGKTILILGASPLAHRMMRYYFKSFDRRRSEKKIRVKIVMDLGSKERFRHVPLSEIRYIPEEIGSVAATNIYGDKVAIIMWNEYNPFAILIESRPLAESYRKIFDVVWEKARR